MHSDGLVRRHGHALLVWSPTALLTMLLIQCISSVQVNDAWAYSNMSKNSFTSSMYFSRSSQNGVWLAFSSVTHLILGMWRKNGMFSQSWDGSYLPLIANVGCLTRCNLSITSQSLIGPPNLTRWVSTSPSKVEKDVHGPRHRRVTILAEKPI